MEQTNFLAKWCDEHRRDFIEILKTKEVKDYLVEKALPILTEDERAEVMAARK